MSDIDGSLGACDGAFESVVDPTGGDNLVDVPADGPGGAGVGVPASIAAAEDSVWSERWGAEAAGTRRWRRRTMLIAGLTTVVVLCVGVGAVFSAGRWFFGNKIVLPNTLGGMSLTTDRTVAFLQYDFTADPPNNGWYVKTGAFGTSTHFAVLALYQWAPWDTPHTAESEMQTLVSQYQAMPGPDGTTRLFSLPTATGDATCATESMIDDVTGKTDYKYELCARVAGHDMALVLTSPASARGTAAIVDRALAIQ